jgi:hypothetical protein
MAATGDVSEGLWSCDAGWWRSPCTQVALSGKAHERWWERRTHQRQDTTPPLLLLTSPPCQATHSCLWGAPSPLFLSQALLSSYDPNLLISFSSCFRYSRLDCSNCNSLQESQSTTAICCSPVSHHIHEVHKQILAKRDPNSWSCVSLPLGVGTTATASSTWCPFHSCEYCDNSHSYHQQQLIPLLSTIISCWRSLILCRSHCVMMHSSSVAVLH